MNKNSALLADLKAEDITLTGNSLVPEFKPDIYDYKYFVQSDIYGIKLYPKAENEAEVFVNGQKVTDNNGVLVKLSQDYESYGVDYSQKAEVKAVNGNDETVYNIEIIRENASEIYNAFKPYVFNDESTGVKMPYELYLPKNYGNGKKYPLVFVLHGAGQRLQSVDMVLKRYESATVWAKDSEKGINECIVIAPQCAEADGIGWTYFMKFLDFGDENAESYKFTKWGITAYNLLQKIKKEYDVDLKRIYMTGVSMGGFGTFEMAVEHPEEFAAIVPVCGGGNPETVKNLKDIPMWIFHAVDDPEVNYEKWCVPTLKALDEAGIKYRKTIYDSGKVFYPSGHFSWTPAYANIEMRSWLFEQVKK